MERMGASRDYEIRNGGLRRRMVPVSAGSSRTVEPLSIGERVRFQGEFGIVKAASENGVVGVSFNDESTVYVSAASLERVTEPAPVLDLAVQVRTLTEDLEKAADREMELHQAFYKLEDSLRDALEQLEATRNSFNVVCEAVSTLGRKFE